MAAKKPATKTSATPKVKASTKTKSTTTKKPVARKATVKTNKKATPTQSFRLSRETEKFISSRITIQTVYWIAIGLAVLAMGLLVLKAQLDILDTLNQISDGLY